MGIRGVGRACALALAAAMLAGCSFIYTEDKALEPGSTGSCELAEVASPVPYPDPAFVADLIRTQRSQSDDLLLVHADGRLAPFEAKSGTLVGLKGFTAPCSRPGYRVTDLDHAARADFITWCATDLGTNLLNDEGGFAGGPFVGTASGLTDILFAEATGAPGSREVVAFAPFHQAAIFTPGSAPALVNLANVSSVVAAVELPGTDRVVALDPAAPSLNVFSFPSGVSDAGAIASVGSCVDRDATDFALSLVDLNGDGMGDVVVESPRDDFFEVHLGYPDGGFEDLTDGATCGAGRTFTIPELGDAGYTLAVADITGDARPDVVVVPRDLDVLEVFTNASGDAGFALLQPSAASSGDSCSRHTLGLSGQLKVGVAAIGSPAGTRLVVATDSQGLHVLGRR